MKKFLHLTFGRLLYTALFVTVQIVLVVVMFLFFRAQFAYFYFACIALSFLAVLHVVGRDGNPAYKIAWIIPILLFPAFGGLLYLMFGRQHLSRREKRVMKDISVRYDEAMADSPHAARELAADSEAAIHAAYLQRAAGAMPFRHTETHYLPTGEAYFNALMTALQQARSFIFLEYFIIEEGKMWNSILEVLTQKVREGVEVRVIYDDFGCMLTLPSHYHRLLEARGIQAAVFHPFRSILNSRFNNRDHRKICVVDGSVGFTGGINLADEYINAREKYGHWKDTGVLLRGQGVWELTAMFLSMWDYLRQKPEDFHRFAPHGPLPPDDGYVLPFTDTPLDNEPVGETVYMNLVNRARRYVYITTPYLVIDNETLTALRTAAKCGVDVRLITPGIPDKKLVYALTRATYPPLLSAGVRIYEYTPGFIHAKTFVADDRFAVVGTINLDFRSLYLHYECAAWMADCRAVGEVKADFLDTLTYCREITPESIRKKSAWRRFALNILRIFAPLM